MQKKLHAKSFMQLVDKNHGEFIDNWPKFFPTMVFRYMVNIWQVIDKA